MTQPFSLGKHIIRGYAMRKLLLGTTALAAAATLTANAALADVTIAGSYEFKYLSRSSNVSTLDGTTMTHGDTDMVVNFTNKTDSGLDLTFRYDIGAVGSTDGGNLTIDEASLAIAGGFGKVVLGMDDDAADAYNIDEMDLIAEEPSATMTSSSISLNSSISSDDAMKVAYHLPAMGGLTAGISHTDRSAAGGTDTTSYGAKYSMDAAGASITLDIGYTTQATDQETGDGGTLTGNVYGSGQEAGVTIKYDALQIGVYGAERENKAHTSGVAVDATTDEFNGVWYAKYSMGPVSIGYSESYVDSGVSETQTVATTTAKTLRTSGGIFEGEQIGIAFNVNDNLSISYSESTETYDAQDDATTAIADVDQEIDAIQVAYSMGGMSIKAYQMDVTNPNFDEDATDAGKTEIALGLAF